MALKVAELFATLSIDDKQFHGSLTRAQRGMQSLGSGIRDAGRLVYGIGRVGAVAFGAMAAGAGVAIRAAMHQERAMRRLEGVVRATGGAAGFSAQEMAKQASALQDVTAYADKAIMEVQAIIATFKGVKGEHFKDATEAALDLATVLGTDAKAGAIQLGKALNDPVRGMASLRDSGVSFTKQQEKMITRMVKQNDLIGAQKIILEELQNEFGGTAREIGTSFVGSIDRAKNKIDDFLEKIGERIAPGVQGFAENIDVPLAAVDKLTGGLVLDREKGAEAAHWVAMRIHDINNIIEGWRNNFLTSTEDFNNFIDPGKGFSPFKLGMSSIEARQYSPGNKGVDDSGLLPTEYLARIDGTLNRILEEDRRGPFR